MSWLTASLGIDKLNKTAAGHAIIQPISDELKTIGATELNLFTATFHGTVAQAATSALHGAATAVENGIETKIEDVQTSLVHGILAAVSGVAPAQVPLFTAAAQEVLSEATAFEKANIPATVAKLIAVLATKLGVPL